MDHRRIEAHAIPDPATRVPAGMYTSLRQWMLTNDPDAQEMLDWSNRTIGPPQSSDEMAREIIWIILCAGRSAQAARTIEQKVWGAFRGDRPVVDVFGHRAKAAAIERAWRERNRDFAVLQTILATQVVERLVEWCGSIPFVGDDTQFQLAKNFGADVCKPDIWLCRLAGIADKPRRAVKFRFPACMALCRGLAAASGDRVAAVDSLLWLACNKGVLAVDSTAGQIRFIEKRITARSIYSVLEPISV